MERRSSSRRLGGVLRRLLLGLLLLVVLLLLTFALPVRLWRTGEQPAPPLPLVPGGPPVELSRRIWIDTDAACGHEGSTDPDDCYALLLLARSASHTVVGISTVHGNAPLAVTDSTTRALVRVLAAAGVAAPPVYRGSATPLEQGDTATVPAHVALRDALDQRPLTIVALGPLTNLALALGAHAPARARVVRLVAVMGRRPGHLFHPAEGQGSGGILFGHGPVFTDFNFAQDPEAAARVLAMGLPMTLVPYEAAREVRLTGADLDALERGGPAAGWIAARSREWLGFWREAVGREGFYPFDLIAAAYVVEPGLLNCARATAWIGEDEKLWPIPGMREALMVGRGPAGDTEVRATGPVVYCPELAPPMHARIMDRLAPGGTVTSGGSGGPAPGAATLSE